MHRPASHLYLSLSLLFILISGTNSSLAAINSYAALVINGTEITGNTSLSHIGGVDVSSGHIECHAVNHELFRPVSQSGIPSSAVTHAPFKLVKKVDKASPLLYQALAQNRSVSGSVKYFRIDQDTGVTEHYFTIQFSNARITGIRHWSPSNIDPAGASYPHMEEVSIVYQSITLREEQSSTETEITVGDR